MIIKSLHDNAWCIEKQNLSLALSLSVPLPSDVHQSIPTVLAFDNIDRLEETLKGSGTSHRVNGIIIQPFTESSITRSQNALPTLAPINEKIRKIEIDDRPLPCYIEKTRNGPLPIEAADLPVECASSVDEAKHKNYVWFLTRLVEPKTQKTYRLNYLPTIDSPATEKATVLQILRRSEEIRKYLQMDCIVVVMDQALYCKAVEILWAHQQEQSWRIFPMMGNFHTICNLLSIIGLLFGNYGLRDLAVDSGVIAEGSIDKVLDGKHYNRAIRLHKLVYEACMIVLYSGFLEWLDSNELNLAHVSQCFTSLCHETNYVSHNSILQDEDVRTILKYFDNYLTHLRTSNGAMSSFWMKYIDLVEIVLAFLRANREGNWFLFLAAVEKMVPWCFALDRVNYSRYLSYHFLELTKLEKDNLFVHQYFVDGGFSVQLRSNNSFSRIPVDQAIEETVNKDTQTPGGTKGFSLKKQAVARYYVNAEHRASALRNLRSILSSSKTSQCHPDLRSQRIIIDEKDVTALAELLANEWTNPFDNNPSDIVHLSTGISVDESTASDLIDSETKGKIAYQEFTSRLANGEGFHKPIKKVGLKISRTKKSKTTEVGNKEVILQCDRNLFSRMTYIAENQQLDMKEVFKYPLAPFPWTLANVDGSLKKTCKSVFAHFLEKYTTPASLPEKESACLIDAMAVLQSIKGEQKTFEELSMIVFKQVLNIGRNCCRVDIVFDVYREVSIKSLEREKRGTAEGIKFSEIKGGHKVVCWRKLLRNSESKNKMIKFFVDSWKEDKFRSIIGNQEIFVTVGEMCFRITSFESKTVPELFCTQEEADSRMMLHARNAASSYESVLCFSNDTDVLVLAVGLCKTIKSKSLCIVKKHKIVLTVIQVSQIVAALGEQLVTALIGYYCWSGCDTVSAFAGQGKVKGFKLLCKKEQKCIEAFSKLGRDWVLSDDVDNIIEEFVCQLYAPKCKVKSVDELRYQMFRGKEGQIESFQMPPCKDTLRQHNKRANYQAGIWLRSLETKPLIPDPFSHGWEKDISGNLSVKWMEGLPALECVLSFLRCHCKSNCAPETCSCLATQIRCTESCGCKGCTKETADEEECNYNNYNSDSSEED
ncbi:unnamed protein product [Phaedon cochleariae]|uniref:Tesmin/TSO1-like CXC domain-containing protein n=1 Tax=Phaedon cochleariae TaxID=80249 RepID=A0A9N9SJC2_PHACE|nr:unnamed protein product [Phaedon cochleariae]